MNPRQLHKTDSLTERLMMPLKIEAFSMKKTSSEEECYKCGKSGIGLYSMYNRTYCERCKDNAIPTNTNDPDEELNIRCSSCDAVITRASGWYHKMDTYRDKCSKCIVLTPSIETYERISEFEDLKNHSLSYQKGTPIIGGKCVACSSTLIVGRGWFHKPDSDGIDYCSNCLPHSERKNYKNIKQPEDFGNDPINKYYILTNSSDSDDE